MELHIMPPTTNEQQTVPLWCPHCGAPMDTHVQRFQYKSLDTSTVMATCWQDGCAFKSFTTSEASLSDLCELQKQYASVGLIVQYDPMTGALLL